MMLAKLAILGGSSPFTVALIDALVDATPPHTSDMAIPPMRMALTGRHVEHLALVLAYARSRLCPLGWRCEASTDAQRTLDGAEIVIHQNRYGDMTLRAAGERMCHTHSVLADETLGPAALLTALVGQPALRRTIALIARYCPNAVVLNLTNPLSLVTGVMARTLPRCVGLCELPAYTALQISTALGLDGGTANPDDGAMRWDYQGMNHRGFLVRLTCEGEDLLPRLINTLMTNAAQGTGPDTIGGICATSIADLGAVPLKYFSVFSQPARAALGRAEFLNQLREQILLQLRQDGSRSPPAAKQRYQAWYPLAVVPMLRALSAERESTQVVNVLRDDGLVWEVQAPVSRAGIGMPRTAAPSSAATTDWLQRFQIHEQATIQALTTPTRPLLLRALHTDPTVPTSQIDGLLTALTGEVAHHERTRHAEA